MKKMILPLFLAVVCLSADAFAANYAQTAKDIVVNLHGKEGDLVEVKNITLSGPRSSSQAFKVLLTNEASKGSATYIVQIKGQDFPQRDDGLEQVNAINVYLETSN